MKPKLYLAGPIEYEEDHGVGIRKTIRDSFDTDLFTLVDPCDFSFNQENSPSMRDFITNKSNEFSVCTNYCRRVANGDLNAIKQCDGIIAILNENAGSGTSGELTAAKWMEDKIPVFAYIDKNKVNWREINPWILGQLDQDKICTTIEKLKKRILQYYVSVESKIKQ